MRELIFDFHDGRPCAGLDSHALPQPTPRCRDGLIPPAAVSAAPGCHPWSLLLLPPLQAKAVMVEHAEH